MIQMPQEGRPNLYKNISLERVLQIVIILPVILRCVQCQISISQLKLTDNKKYEEVESINSEIRRGLLSIFGQLLQSTALSLVDLSQLNLAFKTRIKELSIAGLLLLIGSVLVGMGGEKRLDGWFAVITVIAIRIDTLVNLIAGLMRIVDWYRDTQEEDMYYDHQIWPLQAAACIWNNCKEVVPITSSENDKSALLGKLENLLKGLGSRRNQNIFTRIIRFPFYLAVLFLVIAVRLLENLFDKLFGVLSRYKIINKTPLRIYGDDGKQIYRLILGHTMLVKDFQLDWVTSQIQNFDMQQSIGQGNTKTRSQKKVIINAVHLANLLDISSFRRLTEHAVPFRGMNWYYKACGNNLYKKVIEAQSLNDLRVFSDRPNGNNYDHGEEATKQLLWARLLVGRLQLENKEFQWLTNVTTKVYQKAYQLSLFMDTTFSKSGIGRHVYTVTRRWMVDFIMFLWWRDDLELNDINFYNIKQIYVQNQKYNTRSLPHAMAYLLIHPNVSGMLPIILGNDWQSWAQDTYIRGQKLIDAIKYEPIWQCVIENLEDVHIPQELYDKIYIQQYIAQDNQNSIDQIRIRILTRIVDVLVTSSLVNVGYNQSTDISINGQQNNFECIPLMEQ